MAAMAAKGAFDLLLLESTGVSEPMQVGVVGQKEGGGVVTNWLVLAGKM